MANFVSPNQIHNQIGRFFWFGTILETILRNLTDRRGQGWEMERNDRHHNCHARMSPLVHGEITDRPSDENPRGRGERDAPCLSDRLRDAVMREGCTACRSKMNGVCLPSSSVLSYGRLSDRSGDLVDPSRVYLPGGQEIRQILGNRASGAAIRHSTRCEIA